MEITNTYRNNIKEIEKFINSFSFLEASEQRIRQYIENPVACVNDKIKALFEKYSDYVVDYRIPLPESMLKTVSEQPREVVTLCRFLTNMLANYEPDKLSQIVISNESVAQNYFMIGKDRKKVWRYINGHITDMAKNVVANTNNSVEVDLTFSMWAHSAIYTMVRKFVAGLGSRSTSIKTKFSKWLQDANHIECNVDKVAESLKVLFNIAQEVVSAKIIDQNKFKLYLSFNPFDWLLASTAETFHSCIDMESSMCYGLGMLGMCGCPDWGMLLYTDGTNKSYMGIETLHIITRSWACNLEDGSFKVVGWYPKDIRGSVNLENVKDCDFSFNFGANDEKSYSEWEPVVFNNGAVAWIYSDLNQFEISKKDNKKVFFRMRGAAGTPQYSINRKGIVTRNSRPFSKCLNGIKEKANSIGGFVGKRFALRDYIGGIMSTCDMCGNPRQESELTYIEGYGIYVCKDCLDRHFFFDEYSQSYVKIDDGVELYFSSFEYDYALTSRQRVENDPEVFYDEISKRYFVKSDKMAQITINGRASSQYTLERYKEIGHYTINEISSTEYEIH